MVKRTKNTKFGRTVKSSHSKSAHSSISVTSSWAWKKEEDPKDEKRPKSGMKKGYVTFINHRSIFEQEVRKMTFQKWLLC